MGDFLQNNCIIFNLLMLYLDYIVDFRRFLTRFSKKMVSPMCQTSYVAVKNHIELLAFDVVGVAAGSGAGSSPSAAVRGFAGETFGSGLVGVGRCQGLSG